MTKNSGSKRLRSPRRAHDTTDGDDGSEWQVQERRTKNRQDFQPGTSAKGKAKVQEVRPTSTKHMRELQVQQDFRRGYETSEDNKEEDEGEDDADTENEDVSGEEAPTQTPLQPAKVEGIRPRLKKPLTVDEHGTPCGSLRKAFEAEVRLLRKDLDPTPSFKDQEEAVKERYFKRLFEGWQVRGLNPKQQAVVDHGWIMVRANKTPTNQRFRFNKMIDKQEPKPAHVSDKHWNKMVKIRMTEAAKEKSNTMRRVSKGKGGKAAVMASLREAAVVKLSIRHQREPFESEIQEEMEEEYERLQANNESDDHTKDALETRMKDLEVMMEATTEQLEEKIDASNSRLESKIDESNRRLEAMFRELIGMKASHTDSTVPQPMDLHVTATPVLLQVTPTPTPTTEKRNAPSPTHGASGVSDRSGEEEANIGALKNQGGGTSMEEADGEGEEEGDAALLTTTVDQVVQEVHDDVETLVSAAPTAAAVHIEKEVVETPGEAMAYGTQVSKPSNVRNTPSKIPKPAGLSKLARKDTAKPAGPSKATMVDATKEVAKPKSTKVDQKVAQKRTSTRADAVKTK